MFLHFDCVPLCYGKYLRRSKGGRAPPFDESETVFETQKFQCVDFLLGV